MKKKERVFTFKKRQLVLDGTTRIMGVLNVTPDSFSDGGKWTDPDTAAAHAVSMLDSGADIIDIGGESTRPGAENITAERELQRVLPVIERLRSIRPECIISVDTRKSETARKAVEAGADIINDISGLQYSPNMAQTAAETGAGLVIMHMRGTPETMQSEENLIYENLIGDISSFLKKAAGKAIKAGVRAESIIVDPGIGFSKTTEQNLEIIADIEEFHKTGYPLLVGPSRKSFIGKILGENDPEKRIWGTCAAVCHLAEHGVEFVRVHDIEEMKKAVTVTYAIKSSLKKTV